MIDKRNVLFLCTANSCRSQIAEGYLRHFAPEIFNAYSAGSAPADQVHPLAVQVMSEAGIDISQQQPKGVKDYLGRLLVQHLIIVCDDAQQHCPKIFPGMRERLLWPIEDPAQFVGSPDETLAVFRRVRDEIRDRIVAWLAKDR